MVAVNRHAHKTRILTTLLSTIIFIYLAFSYLQNQHFKSMYHDMSNTSNQRIIELSTYISEMRANMTLLMNKLTDLHYEKLIILNKMYNNLDNK